MKPLTCEILQILSRDARSTPETIAVQTGKSVQEVRASIEKYERDGVIKRYATVIDWEKAGVEEVTAFIDVRVVPARDVGFDGLAARIARYPEVQSVWLVSGGSDLRVAVQSTNLKELANFIAEKLATIDGVNGTVTHFILRRYKEDHTLYLDEGVDERLVVTP
ncbi:MAG: Lrp/AsnC family transcriptional regulator [Cyanobacteria bacterium REEB67]|nr:Lrp/AsnC family transcriptional regulator [Cyanobacteria bacterium REEB67]